MARKKYKLCTRSVKTYVNSLPNIRINFEFFCQKIFRLKIKIPKRYILPTSGSIFLIIVQKYRCKMCLHYGTSKRVFFNKRYILDGKKIMYSSKILRTAWLSLSKCDGEKKLINGKKKDTKCVQEV